MSDPVLAFYAACYDRHGDTAQGAGWPNEPDRRLRFDVILDLVDHIAPAGPVTLLDCGCGTGELLRRIGERPRRDILYKGVDALGAPLAEARRKFPDASFQLYDLAADRPPAGDWLACDVMVANGVFTVRNGLPEEEMWRFMTGAVGRLWPWVRRGVIFNVMSPVVDWRREDLFHVSYDRLAGFLHELAGRTIGFRADYGLYEYMAYAIRGPSAPGDGPEHGSVR